MPRKNIESVNFHVPIGATAQIEARATEQGLEVSEYIRKLIEADFKAATKTIDLTVMKRGQYPRKKTEG